MSSYRKTMSEALREVDEMKLRFAEAKYELYHKDFSSAMQHAYHVAKKHHGITIDPKEIDAKVATGPSKPSEGKTNTYRLKGDKGAVQVQVYNKGGSKPFELNMYKEEVKALTPTGEYSRYREEVELDESVIDKVKEIASKKSAAKIDGTMVDSFTASAISQIYDKVNDANKKKMEKLPIIKLATLAMKMMQKNEYVPEDVELDEAAPMTTSKQDATTKRIKKRMKDKKEEDELDEYGGNFGGGPMRVTSGKKKKDKKEDIDEAKEKSARQLIDPNKEVMVVKKNKVIVIDKKDQDKYIKQGYSLAEASARADAMKAMRKGKSVDPADVDNTATDDDVKAASKNIIMQLRKAVSLRSYEVEFADGKHKVNSKIAQAVQNKYNTMRRPADKEKYQMQIAKSYKDMMRSLKAGYGEQKETILSRIGNKLKERKNG